MHKKLAPNVKEHVVVMWQDSDVPVMIKDRVFGGKLAHVNQNGESDKENQQNDKKPGGGGETNTLKKRRYTKKMSLAPSALAGGGDNPEGALLSSQGSAISVLARDYDKLSICNQGTDAGAVALANGQLLKTLSYHFAIGNQTAAGVPEAISNKTSNNKLDDSMKLTFAEMTDRLKAYRSKFQDPVDKLNEDYESKYFPQWMDLLSAGFNVLLHGVGSKKQLLEKFCAAHLKNHYYLSILGYHHDFNIKALFKSIISDVLELQEKFKTIEEQINAINLHLREPLYLVIHNIDGNCLRDSSVQNCLAELAASPNIHIIATVDHINSPMLWDQTQYTMFKWIHFELHTLMAYNDEIMFENSLMLGQAGNVQLSSLIHVLKSLTPNAKNIFYIMAQHVLNPDNTKKNIAFTKLYHECREKFYVSNELTLRAQLTEFIDHKLIKLRAEANGQEAIYVMVDDKNLKLYLEDLKDKV